MIDETAKVDVIGAAEASAMLNIERSTLVRRVQRGLVPTVGQLPGASGAYLFDRSVIAAMTDGPERRGRVSRALLPQRTSPLKVGDLVRRGSGRVVWRIAAMDDNLITLHSAKDNGYTKASIPLGKASTLIPAVS